MTHIDLDHLKQIAQAATQGPWHQGAHYIGVGDDPHDPEVHVGNASLLQDARHIATFDPPTALALIQRICELEAERDRWKERWQATVEDATTQRATIHRVRDARSNHPEIPECDRYTDDDTIKCGWKSAVESIDKALEGDPK